MRLFIRPRRRRPSAAALALGIGCWAAAWPAFARFMLPSEVPVERLINNLSSYIKEHPDDPQGYYVLARVHSLAYIHQRRSLGVYEQHDKKEELPRIDHQCHEMVYKDKPEQNPPPPDEMRAHLSEAIQNFNKAIERAPDRGLYHLGLAFTLEAGGSGAEGPPPDFETPPAPTAEEAEKIEGLVRTLADAEFAKRENATVRLKALGAKAAPILEKHREDPDPEVRSRVQGLFRVFWTERAIAAYARAHTLAFADDGKLRQLPLASHSALKSLVSYEAGTSYLRLVRVRGAADSEKADVARVEQHLATIEKIPPCPAVTPILFPLDAPRPLPALLAPRAVVRFDLAGAGRAEDWPWVRPDTGILAWDPRQTGRVDSGRQLFGNVTWWMFWEDGYHALDALDDDRDGALAGAELRGLAVWRDTNANGVSDPGEVVPVERLGIDRIETRATTHEGRSPANPRGLRLRDGRVLPTYDWVVERARPRP